VFNETLVKSVLIGKEGVLYEHNYVKTYFGSDYSGDDAWSYKANQLAEVRDTLEALGKKLVVVLAPGKGSFYPEYIPEDYREDEMHKTNYEEWSKLLREKNIDLFDVRPWFLNAKDTSRYPLYPKTGIHWSNYGEYLVMDSLVRYIESISEFDLGEIVLDSIIVSDKMRYTDDDLEYSMNLYFDIPDDEMAYPQIHYLPKPESERPKMLTIADSYFWGLFNAGLTTYLFRESEFWYYFESIYPELNRDSYKVAHYLLTDELKDVDIVMILSTETNVYSFGFIEAAYKAYYSSDIEKAEQRKQLRINYYIDAIQANEEWYANIVKQAEEKGISVEQCVRENAEYMVYKERLEQNND
jgi:hypothetical protein